MKQQRKTIAIVLVTAALVALISFKVRAASAKPEPQLWTPGCVANIPKSWGTFRGASAQSGLAFEDANGTIRFLTNIPCSGVPTVSLEVRRSDKQQ
jgi:hypothetical protein